MCVEVQSMAGLNKNHRTWDVPLSELILAQPCMQFWSPVSKKDDFRDKNKAGVLGWSVEPPTDQETVPSSLLQGKADEGEHSALRTYNRVNTGKGK